MRPNYFTVVFALCTSIFICRVVVSQENPLAELRWQKRCVLLITDSEASKMYHRQISALGAFDSEFEARKMYVIDVRKSKYLVKNAHDQDGSKSTWVANSEIYKRYALKGEDFTIVLIGLDGGIKLRQPEVISRQKLFDRIDAMPMRRAEIKNKK